jgi:hypothetical protein
MSRWSTALLFASLFVPVVYGADVPESVAPLWNAVSSPVMDPAKSAHVENLVINRDIMRFTFKDGTIQFTQPVNGVVFGAVFHGTGQVEVSRPNALEAQQLMFFTKQDKLSMTFTDATFSFSDGFYDEVAGQVKWQSSGPANDDLYAHRQHEREDLGAEYLPRLFKGLLSSDRKRTAYLLADLKTKERSWVEFRSDAMQLEELRVGHWADMTVGKHRDVWMNFPAAGRDPHHAYDDPAAREDFVFPAYDINVNLADNGLLSATTKATIHPRYSGERILLFSLDSNLRVSKIEDGQGRALEYFQAQERKDREQSYGDYVVVALKEPLKAEENQTLTFQYAGKHVVIKVGPGNYFCHSFGWYPTRFDNEFGVDTFAFRSDFNLTFRNPKKYSLVATGSKVNQTTDGKEAISTWKSDMPLAAAGFAFGDYKVTTRKVGDIDIEVYANSQPDELLSAIQLHFNNPIAELAGERDESGSAVGILTASSLGKTISLEMANTLNVFQNYFGPYPYKHIAVTNIIGSYGQGWPGLLYLGWFTFLDSTQRHALGIRDQVDVTDFFRGHESSHQWWGHRVGWKSYHDQWLSEGFAEFSGKLYVQYRQNQKEFYTQLRKDKDLLRTGDLKGHRIDTIGPIWLGRRIASSESGGRAYQDLVYSKGGYVLQMLREQLSDPRNADPDHLFKEMMWDYCKTFNNKPASTEDFKSIVEKHMLRYMDLDNNRKMDWFFNEYVYGVGMPHYSFHGTAQATADGKTHLNGQLVRTGVPDNWKDVVGIYAHIGDKVNRLGTLAVTGPTQTIDTTVAGKIDRISINDHEDLLAEVSQ